MDHYPRCTRGWEVSLTLCHHEKVQLAEVWLPGTTLHPGLCPRKQPVPWRGNELLHQMLLSSHPNSKCRFRGLCIIEWTRESQEEVLKDLLSSEQRPRDSFWKFPLGSQAICTEQSKQKPDSPHRSGGLILRSSSFFQNPCPTLCPLPHLNISGWPLP